MGTSHEARRASRRLAAPAVALGMIWCFGCERGTVSDVKDIAPATSVSDQQIASGLNNTDASAAIVYPLLKYMGEGDLTSQGHSFVLTQNLQVTTNDTDLSLQISDFRTTSTGEGSGQVNDSLRPQNGTTVYHRTDNATLAQLDASNPNYKNAEGAAIFIASLTKSTGRKITFTPPVPFMPIPSSAGSYSNIGSGLSYETTVNWGLRNHQATVEIHMLSSDPTATVIQVTFHVADDKDGSIAGFIPIPADGRYVIDTTAEHLTAIWSKDNFKNGTTILYHQLCSSTVPDGSTNFSNATCDKFAKGVIKDAPPDGPANGVSLTGAQKAKKKKKP